MYDFDDPEVECSECGILWPPSHEKPHPQHYEGLSLAERLRDHGWDEDMIARALEA